DPIGSAPLMINGLQHAKRLIKIVMGFTLLAGGVAMLVLPGPGIVAIMAGLALLSEFVWARRLLDRVKAGARDTIDAVRKRTG
ncbi:MAG: PGPGW domain-containing protein, partial [Vicinamibacterales bacterium]